MSGRSGRARLRRGASHDILRFFPESARAPRTHNDLTNQLIVQQQLKSPRAVEAFRLVPRDLFVLERDAARAFQQTALRLPDDTGMAESTASGEVYIASPASHALALEHLQLAEGHAFLNIGCATGILTAIGGCMVGAAGTNHAIDVSEAMIKLSRDQLAKFSARLQETEPEHSFATPVVVRGNCFLLNPQAQQYDRIYCGASMPNGHGGDFTHTLTNLLKPDGILLLPCGDQLLEYRADSDPQFKIIAHGQYPELILPNGQYENRLFSVQDRHLGAATLDVPPGDEGEPSRVSIGRLRSCSALMEALLRCEPLPAFLGPPKPSEEEETAIFVKYQMTAKVASGGHRVRTAPSLSSSVLGVMKKGAFLVGYRVMHHSSSDAWVQLAEVPDEKTPGFCAEARAQAANEAWMLASATTATQSVVYLTREEAPETHAWVEAVDKSYCFRSISNRPSGVDLLSSLAPAPSDLVCPPRQWSFRHDEELATFALRNELTTAAIAADFTAEKLLLYPLLAGHSQGVLAERLGVLLRVATLFDSVLELLVDPDSDYTTTAFGFLAAARHIFALCPSRWGLISRLLHQTSARPPQMPTILIDRRKARSLRDDVTEAPNHCNSMTYQIFDALSRGKGALLHYRWSKRKYEQWWEINFRGEGIIDQGGGFRDSISEICDELCPADRNVRPSTALFVRTPNNVHNLGEHRSAFVPNPGCRDLEHYQWIGRLMGACIRSDESMPLALPPLVWKLLCGMSIAWADFKDVDVSAVRDLESIASAEEELFDLMVDERGFCVTLSNSTELSLVGHTERLVTFDNRHEFIQLAKAARLRESKEQLAALRKGLHESVPRSILGMMTWQELEMSVCGDEAIEIEPIRRHCAFAGISPSEPCVKLLWQVLKQFSNPDRSQFLRFVSGRRRLPIQMTIAPGLDNPEALPSSATCANTLYLPRYSSPETLHEKLRYAIYNCIAIDNDTNPW